MFYEQNVKIIISQSQHRFDNSSQLFIQYFGKSDISCIDEIIHTLFEFNIKHQRIYEKIVTKHKSQQKQAHIQQEKENFNHQLIESQRDENKNTPSKKINHLRNGSDANPHLISAPKKISHQRVKSNLLGDKQSPIISQQSKQK